MGELNGRGRVREAAFGAQVAKYLSYFGYKRVLQLSANMGYPFK
jgi:hypothetical protein